MTWVDLPDNCTFGVDALPYGVFSRDGEAPRVGVRIGDSVMDLAGVASEQHHPDLDAFAAASLNELMSLGPAKWQEVRHWVASLLTDETNRDVVSAHLVDLDTVTMHLPVDIADYVDFYASESHASNVGRLFRPGSDPLTPNWKHLPIGYHGRSSSVVVTGTDVVRPRGQRRPGDDGVPPFGPSTTLDIECEIGFVVGQPSVLSQPVPLRAARDYIFGVVILNDWSARDIQAWEYVPLGPFLGKSFATSISAWVLPLSALAAAEVPLPGQHPAVLQYLRGEDAADAFALDLHLQVDINGSIVSRPEYRSMYWSPAQMLAHLTVNGANVRVGDLFASGTVSGDIPGTYGSLLELTWNGARPLALDDGSQRRFLEDDDTVTITGWAAGSNGARIGLGDVTGTVRAASTQVQPPVH